MPRRLLDDSPRHAGYSAINDNPSELDQKTIEEAAAAMQNRLPGRSRKAKGRFRRQQRGARGDEWRGRLSSYCEASSYDLEKLTTRLKEERSALHPSESGKLYSMRWRVKAHFDVLHLHGYVNAPKTLVKAPSLRGAPMSATSQTVHSDVHVTPSHNDLIGYNTYDTEVSDTETKGLPAQMGGMDAGGPTAQDYVSEDETVDIFLFAFGPVVFWGFSDEQEERELLSDLRSFVDGSFHDVKAADDATEEMEFTYRETTRIVNDLIELTTFKSGEKLSVSSAIAQSCHLSVHEWRLSQTIERNNHIPRELADTGMIHMSGDDISKEIGRLFVERNLINLEPELLDASFLTPEFLWNDTEFESVYRAVYRYLEIESRLEVLNKRLTIVGELLDVLRSQQEHIHANKLEWVIIILVAMEVILQLVWNILLKDVLGWVGNPRNDE